MSNSSLPMPGPKQSRWDYLNALENSPKMSRWEYLNSLENKNVESMRIPNIAPNDFGGDTFYNEPLGNSKSSDVGEGYPVSNSKYRLVRFYQDHKLFAILFAGLVLIAIVVMSTTLPSSGEGSNSKGSSSSSSNGKSGTAHVEPSEILYLFNDAIYINVKTTSTPTAAYWVGIWQTEHKPGSLYTVSDQPAAMWSRLCGDDNDDTDCSSAPKETVVTFSENTNWYSGYTLDWPLCNGKWTACVIDEATNQNLGCSDLDFAVYGGNCDGVCTKATEFVSSGVHLNPTPGAAVSKIAFGSCFEPGNQIDSKLWDHMRQTFQPDLWVWLGDNVYADGEDMERKRMAYNLGKSDPFYRDHGPMAEPKIPVTGTWYVLL
jgi:hypothetical protein